MVEPSYYQLILPFNSILIDVIPLYYQPNRHLDNYNTSHDNFNSPVHDDNHDSYMYSSSVLACSGTSAEGWYKRIVLVNVCGWRSKKTANQLTS